VRLLRAESLERCDDFVSGIPEAAEYSLVVPTAAELASLGERKSLDVPTSRSTQMRFEVPANSLDRFSLTIGPAGGGGPHAPWVYVAEVFLHHDGEGDPLFAGSAAAVSSPLPYEDYEWLGADDADCARRNLATLEAASTHPARGRLSVSPEIPEFAAELSFDLGQAGREYYSCGVSPGSGGVIEEVVVAGRVDCADARDILGRYRSAPKDRLEGRIAGFDVEGWYCIRLYGAEYDEGARCRNVETGAVARLLVDQTSGLLANPYRNDIGGGAHGRAAVE
jgi:hypothetical protein